MFIKFSFNNTIIIHTGNTHFQLTNIFFVKNTSTNIIIAELCINVAIITVRIYAKYHFLLFNKNWYPKNTKLIAIYCLIIFNESKKNPPSKNIHTLNILS